MYCTILFLVLCLWLLRSVHALSTGANSCTGGGPAVGGAHLSDSAVTGELDEGTISFSINNAVLDPSFSEFAIVMGAPLTLLVSGSSFRGALIRVSSTTPYTLTPGVNGQVASVCIDDGVLGVTHTSNDDKTELAAELTVEASPENDRVPVDVDVTVVVTANPSVYYHSTFTVFAVSDLPTLPTVTPVLLTSSPSSLFNGNATAVLEDTDAPSVAFDAIPTITPVDLPASPFSPFNGNATAVLEDTDAPSVAFDTIPTITPVVLPASPFSLFNGNATAVLEDTDAPSVAFDAIPTITPVDLSASPSSPFNGNTTADEATEAPSMAPIVKPAATTTMAPMQPSDAKEETNYGTPMDTAVQIPPRTDSSETTVADWPLHGTISIANDGTITYVPTLGFVGDDSFNLQVCSGASCRVERITVRVEGPSVVITEESTPSKLLSLLYLLVLLPLGVVIALIWHKRKSQASPKNGSESLPVVATTNDHMEPNASASARTESTQLVVSANVVRADALPDFKDQCRLEPAGVRLYPSPVSSKPLR